MSQFVKKKTNKSVSERSQYRIYFLNITHSPPHCRYLLCIRIHACTNDQSVILYYILLKQFHGYAMYCLVNWISQ